MTYSFTKLDLSRVTSPAYVIDTARLEHNLKILSDVQSRSGAKILLALKAFCLPTIAPLVRRHLSGVCASGLFEARLGHQEFGMPIHTHGAAHPTKNLHELIHISTHLVFNSLTQLERASDLIACKPDLKVGLRLNPEVSVTDVGLYNPSAEFSRLGQPRSTFEDQDIPAVVTGFHVHNLCGDHLPALKVSIEAIEAKFPAQLERADWINLGGGHAICEPDYDREGLIQLLQDFAARHKVQVYLEPGETVVHQVGGLVTEVLDVSFNARTIGILDCSATAHIPDSIEMPYRVDIMGSAKLGEKAHDARLGGLSCLSGDVLGDYSFDKPLAVGQRLLIEDTAYYTMVKTTTFNGVALPSIYLWDASTDALTEAKSFDYSDFRRRLG